MKLLSLQLCNFRQFYGETPKIQLADGDRNVTVFHGANGAGKTTILNAFTWLFYRQFTDAFAMPQRLVNRRVLREARVGERVECWVELMFEHNRRKYILRRTQPVTKDDSPEGYTAGPPRVSLDACGEDGRWQRKDDSEIPDVIGRILPEMLLPYFFFDGERLESRLRASKQDEVIAATTMLVGEEVINRAIEHLDGARKKLEGELKVIGDAETGHLIDQKTQAEARRAELEEKRKELASNLVGYRKQKGAIEDELRKRAGARELQKRRDLLNEQAERLEQALSTSRANLSAIISNQGYQAYLRPAIDTFRSILAGFRKNGGLPASIKTSFVEELLQAQTCICGRPLIPGHDPYKEVEGWLERGGLSDVEEVALRMEAEINQLDREVPKFYAELDREQQARLRAREQLSKIETELTQIREELKGSGHEDTRDLELRHFAIEEAIFRTQRMDVEVEQDIKKLGDSLEHLEAEIKRRKGVTEAQQQLVRRLTACKDARETLFAVRHRLRTNFRLDLQDRINHLFTKMSFKPYQVVLDEGYSLTLVDANGQVPVGAGTGESALLSLSFIGAVIDQAKELTSRRDRLPGPDSSAFPLVMDSPFGNLDPVYRRQVSQNIPALANQVVIMASKTQFEGEVENTIHGRIGKEYVLVYHSPKQDAHEDRIVRYGVTYDLVKRIPDSEEWTEIVEVTRRG